MVPPTNRGLPITALQKPFHCSSGEKPRQGGKRPVGDSGHASSQIGCDGSAVSQVSKERSERCYHNPGPHWTQLMHVSDHEAGDVRGAQQGEIRSPVLMAGRIRPDDDADGRGVCGFERAMLRERTKVGLDAAREEGRIGGRRPKLTPQRKSESCSTCRKSVWR